ncbi:hydantoinase/oxoprolinase N-terminal domain-containing protein [Microbacterium forte]|uniref:hydantoinase/oxoprolinase N-terminal domain-containing protein n=1 Tax=Microbacterium forte TaxID=2982533 RepID=UPI0028936796|nr:hydantoinase/oxoprolinase N-terminal domain-containing protein [Microbacterium sp. A(2022)]
MDIGGTFTDVVAYDAESGRLHATKASTTPGELSVGVLNGLQALVPELAYKEGSIAFAGQQIPTSETHLWHQQLEVHPTTATDSPGHPCDYIMSPPQGEHLVAWAHTRLVCSETEPVLASPWDLTGINEKSFP